MIQLFDSHTHIDDEKFDDDREETIRKIFESGVTRAVNIGCDVESSRESIRLAEKYDFIYATVGLHPQEADSITDTDLEIIEGLAKHKKAVAIGEIGLDYYYKPFPRELQKHWFSEQLKMAERLDMPVVIHNRDSHEDMMSILSNTSARGIIHCCSVSKELAKILVDMGFYISFAGTVTFKNARSVAECAATVPLERLLIETDSPYLAPEGHRGERNDSSLVRCVCEKLAEIKNISVEDMAAVTYENACRVYRIDSALQK